MQNYNKTLDTKETRQMTEHTDEKHKRALEALAMIEAFITEDTRDNSIAEDIVDHVANFGHLCDVEG